MKKTNKKSGTTGRKFLATLLAMILFLGTVPQVEVLPWASALLSQVWGAATTTANPNWVAASSEARVLNADDLQAALANPNISTIYLGNDISLRNWGLSSGGTTYANKTGTSQNYSSTFMNIALRPSLTLVGTDPVTGIRHTYTDRRTNDWNYIPLRLPSTAMTFTFKDLDIYAYNYYGLLYGSSDVYYNIVFDGVYGVSSQFVCLNNRSIVTVRDTVLKVRDTGLNDAQEFFECGYVNIAGNVVLDHQGTTSHAFFCVNDGNNPYLNIADGANVSLIERGYNGWGLVYPSGINLVIGKNAKVTSVIAEREGATGDPNAFDGINYTTGFNYNNTYTRPASQSQFIFSGICPLGSVTVGNGSELDIIHPYDSTPNNTGYSILQTNSSKGVTLNEGSILNIYSAESAVRLLNTSNLILNNPRLVTLVSLKNQPIFNGTTPVQASKLRSVRYYSTAADSYALPTYTSSSDAAALYGFDSVSGAYSMTATNLQDYMAYAQKFVADTGTYDSNRPSPTMWFYQSTNAFDITADNINGSGTIRSNTYSGSGANAQAAKSITSDSFNASMMRVVQIDGNYSRPPAIDSAEDGDTTISGTGIAGALVTVVAPSGQKFQAPVLSDGTWTVAITPALVVGQVYAATQQANIGGDFSVDSSQVTMTVKAKVFRLVANSNTVKSYTQQYLNAGFNNVGGATDYRIDEMQYIIYSDPDASIPAVPTDALFDEAFTSGSGVLTTGSLNPATDIKASAGVDDYNAVIGEVSNNCAVWARAKIFANREETTLFYNLSFRNIFTPYKVWHRGVIAGSNPEDRLYDYAIVDSTRTYGFPYEGDKTTVYDNPINDTATGKPAFDQVVLKIPDKLGDYWKATVGQASEWVTDWVGHPVVSPTDGYPLTLDNKFKTSNQDLCDNDDLSKYTLNYEKIPARWKDVDVYYVNAAGVEVNVSGAGMGTISIPLDVANANQSANDLTTKFHSLGGRFIPPYDTNDSPVGWYIGSSFASGTTYNELTDYTSDDFNPIFTDASTQNLYIVYKQGMFQIREEYYYAIGTSTAGVVTFTAADGSTNFTQIDLPKSQYHDYDGFALPDDYFKDVPKTITGYVPIGWQILNSRTDDPSDTLKIYLFDYATEALTNPKATPVANQYSIFPEFAKEVYDLEPPDPASGIVTIQFFYDLDGTHSGIPDREEATINLRWRGYTVDGSMWTIQPYTTIYGRRGSSVEIPNNYTSMGSIGVAGDSAQKIANTVIPPMPSTANWIYQTGQTPAKAVTFDSSGLSTDLFFNYDYASDGTYADVSQFVTEQYYAIADETADGDPITDHPNVVTYLLKGKTYTKTPPAIPGYVYVGYRWDSDNGVDNTITYQNGSLPAAVSKVTTALQQTVTFLYRPAAKGSVTVQWTGNTYAGAVVPFATITKTGFTDEVVHFPTTEYAVPSGWKFTSGGALNATANSPPDITDESGELAFTLGDTAQNGSFTYKETYDEVVVTAKYLSDDNTLNFTQVFPKTLATSTDAVMVMPFILNGYDLTGWKIYDIYGNLLRDSSSLPAGSSLSDAVAVDPKKGSQTVEFAYKTTLTTLYIRCYDENGVEIAGTAQKKDSVNIGDTYFANAPIVTGYALQADEPLIKSIQITNGTNTVVFNYEPRTGDAYIIMKEKHSDSENDDTIIAYQVIANAEPGVTPVTAPDLEAAYYTLISADSSIYSGTQPVSFRYVKDTVPVKLQLVDQSDPSVVLDTVAVNDVARVGEMYTATLTNDITVQGYSLADTNMKYAYVDPSLYPNGTLLVTFAFKQDVVGAVNVIAYSGTSLTDPAMVKLGEHTVSAVVGSKLTIQAEDFPGYAVTGTGIQEITVTKSNDPVYFQYDDIRKVITVKNLVYVADQWQAFDPPQPDSQIRVVAGTNGTVPTTAIDGYMLVAYSVDTMPDAATAPDLVALGTPLINIGQVNDNRIVYLCYKDAVEAVTDQFVTIAVRGVCGAEQLYEYNVNRMKNSGDFTVTAMGVPGYSLADPSSLVQTVTVGESPPGDIVFNFVSLSATVTIKAYVDGTTDTVPGYTDLEVPALAGRAFFYNAPYIQGWNLSDNSSIVQIIDSVSDEDNVMVFHYTQSTGNITLVLKETDTNGRIIMTQDVPLPADQLPPYVVYPPNLEDDYYLSAGPDEQRILSVDTPQAFEFYYTKMTRPIAYQLYDLTGNTLTLITQVDQGIYRVGEIVTFDAPQHPPDTDGKNYNDYKLIGDATKPVPIVPSGSQYDIPYGIPDEYLDSLEDDTDATTTDGTTTESTTTEGTTTDDTTTDGTTTDGTTTDGTTTDGTTTDGTDATQTAAGDSGTTDGDQPIEGAAGVAPVDIAVEVADDYALNNPLDEDLLSDNNSPQIIRFFYISMENVELVVNLVEDSSSSLLRTYSIDGAIGQSLTISAPYVPGYVLAPEQPLNQTGIVGSDPVVFRYVANVSTVTVKLVRPGGADLTSLAPADYSTSFTVERGQSRTVVAPNLSGYVLADSSQAQITLSAEDTLTDQTVVFTYNPTSDLYVTHTVVGQGSDGVLYQYSFLVEMDQSLTTTYSAAIIPGYTAVEKTLTLPNSQSGTATFNYLPATATIIVDAVAVGTNTSLPGFPASYYDGIVNDTYSVRAPYVNGYALNSGDPLYQQITVASDVNRITFNYIPLAAGDTTLMLRETNGDIIKVVKVVDTVSLNTIKGMLAADNFDYDESNLNQPNVTSVSATSDGPTYTFYYVKQTRTVTVSAVDENGIPVPSVASMTYTGRVGEMFSASAFPVTGYALIEPPTKSVYVQPGSTAPLAVTFSYTANQPQDVSVTAFGIDGGDRKILFQYTVSGAVGTSVEVSVPTSIDGWNLKTPTDNLRDITVSADPTQNSVAFEYVKKTATVHVTLKDSTGAAVMTPSGYALTYTVQADLPVTVWPAVIDGYTLISADPYVNQTYAENANETLTFVYQRVTSNSAVVFVYKDGDGKLLDTQYVEGKLTNKVKVVSITPNFDVTNYTLSSITVGSGQPQTDPSAFSGIQVTYGTDKTVVLIYTYSGVTISPDTDGTVSIVPQNPTADQYVTVTITPKPGYDLDYVTITDENNTPVDFQPNPPTMGADGTYRITYEQPAGGVTITPHYKAKSIVIDPTVNGQVTAEPTEPLPNGEVTLTLTPDNGYVLDSLTLTGSDGNPVDYSPKPPVMDSSGNYVVKYTQPEEGSVTVDAVYRPSTPVVIVPHDNGTASVNPAEPKPGQRVTVTVTPDEGYVLDTLTISDKNGTPVSYSPNPPVIDSNGNYVVTYTQPEGGATVDATYAQKHGVNITTPVNGTVTADTIDPAPGAEVTLTITPDNGYVLDTLTLTDSDGNPVNYSPKPPVMDNSGNYVVKYNQPANGDSVTVNTTFRPSAPVVITPHENGTASVDPAEPKPGQRVTVTVTPDAGYEIDTLTISDKDGNPVGYVPNPPVMDSSGNYVITYTQPDGGATVDATYKKKQGVHIIPPVNGTVTANTTTPAAGEEVTLTITPDEGYILDTLTLTDNAGNPVSYSPKPPVLDSSGNYVVTYDQPADGGSVTVNTTFRPSAPVVITTPENGTVTVNPTEPNPGQRVAVTITPNTGYELDTLTITGKDDNPVSYSPNPPVLDSNGNYVVYYTQPEGGATVDTTFRKKQGINFVPSVNGQVVADPTDPAPGQEVSLTITPNVGYDLDTLTITDKDGNVLNYSPKPPTRNSNGDYVVKYTQPAEGSVTVDATYRQSTPVIVTPPENGTISVSPAEPKPGQKVALTLTPAAGFELDTLTIVDSDGNAIGYLPNPPVLNSSGNYVVTYTQPEGGATVNATFTQKHGVNITPPVNGTVTANTIDPAPGEDVTLTITPDTGYVLDTITLTDSEGNPVDYSPKPPVMDNSGNYVVKYNQPANGDSVTVDTTFRPSAPVVITPHENGTASVDPAEPKPGQRVTVTVTPDAGYEIDALTISDKDGNPVGYVPNPPVMDSSGNYVITYTQPDGGATVDATYKKKQGVHIIPPVNGTVTANTTTPAAGEEVTLTITPDEGYILDTLTLTDNAGNPVSYSPKPPVLDSSGNYVVTYDQPADGGSVTVNTTFRPSAPVVVTPPENGTVTVNPTEPSPGQRVAVTITPNTGYELDTLAITDKDDNPVSYSPNPPVLDSNGNYVVYYTQPEGGATVDTTFRKKQGINFVPSVNGQVVADPTDPAPGQEVSLTITPNVGYDLDTLTITDKDGNVLNYSPKPPTRNSNGDYVVKYTQPAEGSVTVDATYRQSTPVIVTPPENGTISVSPAEPKPGQKVAVTLTPAAGFELDTLTIVDSDGNAIGYLPNPPVLNSSGNYVVTYTQPEGGATVNATFTQKHGVNITPPVNGTVTANTIDPAPGEEVTLTITPDNGYVLDTLTLTDSSGNPVDYSPKPPVMDNSGNYVVKYDQPANGDSVTVDTTFRQSTPVVVTTPENGTVTVSPTEPKPGQRVTVTITPDPDYDLDTLSIIGKDGNPVSYSPNPPVIDSSGNYVVTYTQPEGGATVNTTFAKKQGVHIIPPVNGEVTANTTDPAPGEEVTLTITPDNGYVLDTLTLTDSSGNPVDYSPKPPVMDSSGNYVVKYDQPENGDSVTVNTTFRLSTPVVVTTPENGTVAVNPVEPKPGQRVTVTVTPNTGYELDTLAITDKDSNAVSYSPNPPVLDSNGNYVVSYTQPEGGATVDTTFRLKQSVVIVPPANGDVTVEPTNPGPGEEVTLTLTPDNGYDLDSLTIKDKNGNPVGYSPKPPVRNSSGDYVVKYTQPADGSVTVETVYRPSAPVVVTQQQDNGDVTISPAEPKPGQRVTVTITPNDGYELNTLTITDKDGNAVGYNPNPPVMDSNGDYVVTYTQPEGGATVDTTYRVRQSVVITPPINGEVSAEPSAPKPGKEVTLTITPDEGYILDTLTLTDSDGNPVDYSPKPPVLDNNGDYLVTYTQPLTGGVTVVTSFREKTPVVIGTLDNGSVTTNPANPKPGEYVTATITPDDGYELDTLTITGNASGSSVVYSPNPPVANADGTYTVSYLQPEGGVTIDATFVPRVIVTVNLVADNGIVKIIPASPRMGDKVTVVTSPEYGYVLKDLSITDGLVLVKDPGTDGIYTYMQTVADITITATFVESYLAITTKNGSITMDPANPKPGQDVTITLTPNHGFTFNAGDATTPGDLVFTNASGSAVAITLLPATPAQSRTVALVGSTTSYHFIWPADVPILQLNLEFSASGIKSNVIIEPTDNGSITVNNPNPSENESVIVIATPNTGYRVGTVEIVDSDDADIQFLDLGGLYSYKQPAGDVTITVTFVANDTNITVVPATHGHITFEDADYRDPGEEVKVMVVPDSGYTANYIRVNGNEIKLRHTGYGMYAGSYAQPRSSSEITGEFVPNLTVETVPDATISTDVADPAPGEEVTIIVTPDAGYSIASLSIGGDDVTVTPLATGAYAATYYEPLVGGSVVSATMERSSAPVTPATPEETLHVWVMDSSNGRASVNNATPSTGSKVTITTTANSSYELSSVSVMSVDGAKIPTTQQASGVYTFTQPAADVMVAAAFSAIPTESAPTTPTVTPTPTDSGTKTITKVVEVPVEVPAQPTVETPAPTQTETTTTTSVTEDSGISAYLVTNGSVAFVTGYDGGDFRPNASITRAEAAMMFYNLLINKNVGGNTTYTDVKGDEWYANAVSALSALGVISGMPDGSFRPNTGITRAEFTAMAARFAKPSSAVGATFTDVSPSHWAAKSISNATAYGWISGYPDGSFQPERSITRAEAVTMMNLVVGQAPEKEYIDANINQLLQFRDVQQGFWAYYQIETAANARAN